MLSYLGSLNYYKRFIEDFTIYEAVLYESLEAELYEIRRLIGPNRPTPEVETDRDPRSKADSEGRTRW